MAKIRLENITFKCRRDAGRVLSDMEEILDRYGSVTVADYYELAGGTPNRIDNNYGWRTLDNAVIILSLDFGYFIMLPDPINLTVEPVTPKPSSIDKADGVRCIKDINLNTAEGKMLLTAVAMISTRVNTDKTCDEIVMNLNNLVNETDW